MSLQPGTDWYHYAVEELGGSVLMDCCFIFLSAAAVENDADEVAEVTKQLENQAIEEKDKEEEGEKCSRNASEQHFKLKSRV